MADITPMIPAGRQVIDGYAEGRFCVAGEWRDGAVLVFPDVTHPWPVDGFDQLTIDDFQVVINADPRVEILLLGCGARGRMVPKALRAGLRAAGVIVEAMDSSAVCRTYNVLLSEDRRVAAAILPL